MKPPAILFAALLTVGCSHTMFPETDSAPGKASRETAIRAARQDLALMGIEPDAKRLTIIGPSNTKGYFDQQPHNDYWDQGRAAVGPSPFYILNFSEPLPTTGGVHQYFIHAETHLRLWVARSR